jgi:pyruvate formate lyase activating enzyme
MQPRRANPHPDAHAAPWTERVRIGSIVAPSPTGDWPGTRAATVFVRGCPWRCAYCHNPHLQPRSRAAALGWADVAAQLERCRSRFDGVVFSGGEPTSDRTLPDQMHWARERGFRIGLHTNGAYPAHLSALLPLVDWIGFDLKTDHEHYDALTGARGSADRVTQSARLIVDSGIDHEFRLTWHHDAVSERSALLVAHFAQQLGARRFVLQAYIGDGVASGLVAKHSAPPPRLLQRIAALFDDFQFREENCGLDTGYPRLEVSPGT